VDETSDTLRMIKSNESAVLGGFSAYTGNDTGLCLDVIGRHSDADVNDNGVPLLLQQHFLPTL